MYNFLRIINFVNAVQRQLSLKLLLFSSDDCLKSLHKLWKHINQFYRLFHKYIKNNRKLNYKVHNGAVINV